jgi:membrane protein implicated in regulation of membrane protease activity
MEAMKEFLGIATNAEAVYWIIAIAGSFLFLVKLILNFLGGDSDVDADIDVDADGETGFSWLNLNTIIAFLKSLGWVGVLAYRLTQYTPVTIMLIAVVSGVISLLVTAYVLRKMQRLEATGTLNFDNAIGKIARVYLSIPAAGADGGMIQVRVQGRLQTVAACTDGAEIAAGAKVLVYDYKNKAMWVEAYPDEKNEEEEV